MYESISMKEFEQLMKKEILNIIDVREAIDYDECHINEAVLVPLATLPEKVADLVKEEVYYVICYTGNRSGMACEWLSSAGFQVKNVLGGMSEWQNTFTGDEV